MKKVITLLAIICVAAMLLAGCQNTPAEHTHTLIHNEEKAPTCINNGIKEHWYCPECNGRFADEAATESLTFADLEVEELGHIGGTATCTEQAVCERCEKPYGDPLGHTGGTATCTEQAVCERCNQPYGSALSHTPGDAATCTTAQVCTVCNTELAPAAGHTPGADATCTADQVCTVCDEVLVAAKGHADANADYKCDACSTKMLPADGTALTIPQALAVAKVAGSSYTTQKYYITGVIKNVYNTTYGNMYIKDEAGNEICIYGLYTWNKAVRYDKMDYKPVAGDEITVYTVLGAYNTTYQGKDAWLDEVVAHEHDYKAVVTEPTCTKDGFTTHTCTICDSHYTDSVVAALGHTTENGTCERCGLTLGGDAPAYETFTADFDTIASANSSYGTYKTKAGWQGTNCAVVQGGSSDSNPTFKVLGATSATKGYVLNGKTSAKGKLVSPTLSGGISKITFNYTNVFSESNGVDITITIKQNGTAVATKKLDNNSVTQLTAYTFEWDLAGEGVAVSGDFTIEITNNSPSNNSSKNKDRVAIWNLEWNNNPA